METEGTNLLLKITGCGEADKTIDSLLSGASTADLPCAKICNYQIQAINAGPSTDGFTKTMFHVPEPWNGDLETADILFVSSNPSIELGERFPKFAGGDWTEKEIEEFFVRRFDNPEYDPTFKSTIRKVAGYILGEIGEVRKLDRDHDRDVIKRIEARIATTEIVHCKSKKEEGVEEAAGKCFERHTRPVVNYFLESSRHSGNPKTVIFNGAQAHRLLSGLAGRNVRKVDITNDVVISELVDFCVANFGKPDDRTRFLFLSHPVPYTMSDSNRQKMIDAQLDRWG